MRLIRRSDVKENIPPSWIDGARKKGDELKEAYKKTAAQRTSDPVAWRKEWSKTVEEAKSLWQDKRLKQAFIDASNGKCWYCEANVTQRGDVAIDHFRPKNRVHEDANHEGYWWLACEWKNYRYACTYCNSRRYTEDSSGGKQDQFPLCDETRRAKSPDLLTDDEEPVLLDPMEPSDVVLLTFDRTGIPVPAVAKDENLRDYERVHKSIEIFHLHRSDFNSKRRSIMTKMEEHLEQADKQARLLGQKSNPSARSAYNQALATLVDYVVPRAEFSAAARAYLRGMRGTSRTAALVLEEL